MEDLQLRLGSTLIYVKDALPLLPLEVAKNELILNRLTYMLVEIKGESLSLVQLVTSPTGWHARYVTNQHYIEKKVF